MEYLWNLNFILRFYYMSKNIGNLLINVIPEQHRWKMDLFQQWESIIGSLSDKVRIESIYKDQLILGVIHPAWAQELYLMSHVIKQKVNNALKDERIKEIRFRSVDFDAGRKKIAKRTDPHATLQSSLLDKKKFVITEKERKKLSHIKNEDLRMVLEKFCVRCKRSNSKKG